MLRYGLVEGCGDLDEGMVVIEAVGLTVGT